MKDDFSTKEYGIDDHAYGLGPCKDIRATKGYQNADSYAILALGLYLQFPDIYDQFTWVTGAIYTEGNNRGRPYVNL